VHLLIKLSAVLWHESKACIITNNADSICVILLNFEIFSCETVQKIVKMIEDSRVVVISGETGCGKTTQVFAALYELFNSPSSCFCEIVMR